MKMYIINTLPTRLKNRIPYLYTLYYYTKKNTRFREAETKERERERVTHYIIRLFATCQDF